MDKNQIIFLIVTFLFIIGYYYFIYPKYVNLNQNQNITQTKIVETPVNEQLNKEDTLSSTSTSNSDVDSLLIQTNENKISTLQNNNLTITIASLGGEFYNIGMRNSEELVIDPEKNSIFSTDIVNIDEGLVSFIKPVDFQLITNDDRKIVLKKQFIDLAGKNCEIEKIIERVSDYKYSISISIKGLQNNIPKLNYNFSLFSFDGKLGPVNILSNKNNKQEIFYNFAKKYKPVKISKKAASQIADFDWVNIQNLYFSIIIEKANANNSNGLVFLNPENTQTLLIKSTSLDLVDNTYKFNFYTLPKDRKILTSYNKNFSAIVDRFGILNPIVIGFEYLLGWLFSILKNWGISIIILALIIKAILFPLTRQSTISMKKISQLNPQIKEIQEKYKDNPQKANIEMQALYKREKINPLSGCLPLLLQFPFLIALYNALMYNQGLRGASFLWIKDLSIGDSILHLPFNIPLLGTDLRLLPFIMLLTQVGQTIFQSKSQVASTKEQEMQSKMMMWLLPIVFFFVLYNMSSGLILYWTCLNILSIIETSTISVIEGKKLALKNK